MTTTWRERIAEARARGEFNREDHMTWASCGRCLVGEVRERFGFIASEGPWIEMYGPGYNQGRIIAAINSNDFDEVERQLEAVEDHALAVKRGAS